MSINSQHNDPAIPEGDEPESQTGGGLYLVTRILKSTAVWGIVLLLFVAWFGLRYLDSMGGPQVLRERWGWFAAIPLVGLHAVVGVSPFPGETIALANSMLFGFRAGVVCNWCGWMLAAWIQYLLVRRATTEFHVHGTRAWQRIPARLSSLPMQHPAF